MPKLGHDDARAAEKAAEEGGPELIPEGTYLLQLLDVEVSDKPGDSGYHYWSWQYKIIDEDSKFKGREIRLITSLSPKAAFSIGGAFAAHGVPADTHTDELLGSKVWGRITVGKISKGPRAGEDSNNLAFTIAYEGGDEETKTVPDDF